MEVLPFLDAPPPALSDMLSLRCPSLDPVREYGRGGAGVLVEAESLGVPDRAGAGLATGGREPIR